MMEIDLSALNQLSSENLRVVLRKIPGSKDVVMASELMRPLDHIAGMSLIKSCGVERVYRLQSPKEVDDDDDVLVGSQVVFMLRSADLSHTKLAAARIKKAMRKGDQTKQAWHVIFVPRVLIQNMTLLEEEGLHGLVHCHSFAWEPIPIDQNVLSLEVGRVHHFRDLFVDRNTASLWEYARAVVGVQSLYGQIPNRVAVGGLACAVLDQVKVMENASLYSSAVPSAANKTSGAPGSGGSGRSEIGHVFLFDRALDLTPLLLSPLTYEALLDETFGVTCGFVELDPSIAKSSSGAPVRLHMNNKDKLFAKIRGKVMGPDIFTVLSSCAKTVQQQADSSKSKSITEMKQFVQNDLKDFQNLSKAISLHISALEFIQQEKGPLYEKLVPIELALLEAAVASVTAGGTGAALASGVGGGSYKEAVVQLEDCIAQKFRIESVLRLLCLTSHCCNGIFSSDLDRIKTQFLHSYGFHHLVTFNRLICSGFVCAKESLARKAISVPASKVRGGSSSQFASVANGVTKVSFGQMAKRYGLVNPSKNSGAAAVSNGGTDPFARKETKDHPSYVFNGAYMPLAVKVLEEALAAGKTPTALSEYLKDLQVKTKLTMVDPASSSHLSVEAYAKKVLVVMVGGYTMAEVGAFRQLQAITGHQFLVCGGSNITEKDFAGSLTCQGLV